MAEVGDRRVEEPGPRDQADDLPLRQPIGVEVHDLAREEVQHLPPEIVEPQDPRDEGQPRREMGQQRVHRRRPGADRAAHGVADPVHAADVAGQPLLVAAHERSVCSGPPAP